jgi:hypothetical protein
VKPRLAALALALALLGSAARADSPLWGSFELGAGPWRPDIDSDFATSPGPYQTVFGTSRRWSLELGVSKALLTGVGSLELGLRSGWFRARGKGLIDEGGTFTKSGDPTTFNIVPTSLTLTYRLDFLPERLGVPVAPYARVALERYNWWVTNGSGGTVKKGATNGWSATAGLALDLGFIDPTLAREMDDDSGVNRTYLYLDATRTFVDDFGAKDSWDLSGKGVVFSGGLLLVF